MAGKIGRIADARETSRGFSGEIGGADRRKEFLNTHICVVTSIADSGFSWVVLAGF
jgi:hypothetical protein